MPKNLIYNPSAASSSHISSAVPIEAYSSPIRFPRSLNRGGGRTSAKTNTLEPVETKGAWIYPGSNLNIPDEEYEYITKHPIGQQLISRGALRVIEAKLEEGKLATGLTQDYTEPDAMELIRNSYDLDWMERSARREDRPVIAKALSERIKGLSTSRSQTNG